MLMFSVFPCRGRQPPTRAGSGIAQLRQANDMVQDNEAKLEDMNIDDYIDPNSTASPANLTPSPPTPLSSTKSSAIPIKQRREQQEHGLHSNFPPSAPSRERARSREFDYVQRRVRKTSIDETRASSSGEFTIIHSN